MLKKKMYIHIGSGKTGTTSIQNFMCQNADILKKNEIIYPNAGMLGTGHHEYAMVLRNLSKQMTNFNDIVYYSNIILNEINSSNCRSVVLSSENFFESSYESILLLKSLFINFDINIIVYVRECIKLLESVVLHRQMTLNPRYQEIITSTVNIYRDIKTPFCSLPHFNDIISPWENIFGQSAIKASLYDSEIIGADVRYHFLGQIGIDDPKLISELHFDSEQANPSIHPLLSNILTKIDANGGLSSRSEIINEVLNISMRMRAIKHSLFSPDQKKEIKENYAESNDVFADKYLTSREKELFLDYRESTEEERKVPLIPEETNSSCGSLNLVRPIQDRDSLTQDLHVLQMELERVSNINLELQNSTSWKITSPLRSVKNKFSTIVNR